MLSSWNTIKIKVVSWKPLCAECFTFCSFNSYYNINNEMFIITRNRWDTGQRMQAVTTRRSLLPQDTRQAEIRCLWDCVNKSLSNATMTQVSAILLLCPLRCATFTFLHGFLIQKKKKILKAFHCYLLKALWSHDLCHMTTHQSLARRVELSWLAQTKEVFYPSVIGIAPWLHTKC